MYRDHALRRLANGRYIPTSMRIRSFSGTTSYQGRAGPSVTVVAWALRESAPDRSAGLAAGANDRRLENREAGHGEEVGAVGRHGSD